MTHSPEPWKSTRYHIEAADGFPVCVVHPDDDYWHICNEQCKANAATDAANEERICVCVNALAGVPTDALEQMPPGAVGRLVTALLSSPVKITANDPCQQTAADLLALFVNSTKETP